MVEGRLEISTFATFDGRLDFSRFEGSFVFPNLKMGFRRRNLIWAARLFRGRALVWGLNDFSNLACTTGKTNGQVLITFLTLYEKNSEG